jgi:Fur family transcriptional regulator, iron response regulator
MSLPSGASRRRGAVAGGSQSAYRFEDQNPSARSVPLRMNQLLPLPKDVETVPVANASLRGCPLSELRDKLRRAGLRPTRQRVSLGWLLFGRGDRHITAEGLYEEAMKARVPVSLATVYNTLHQFTDAGLLRQLAVEGSKAHFDTNPSEHHHFFLEEEGVLIDMPHEGNLVTDLPAAPPGMEVAGVEVIVRLRRKGA